MMSSRLDHDRLFKELIETFFEEFIHLFFPNVYEHLDFQTLRFLSEELFTDVTEGEKFRLDLVVETKVKDEPGLVIVHVEPQSYKQDNFNERMFIYFSRLYQKYRRKIVPIAIFSYNNPRNEPDSFQIDFPFLKPLDFQFLIIELKKQNWREFIRYDNPIAAALLSKMGYTISEKIEVKKEFFRMLLRLELDTAREALIAGFFESYLKLSEQEEQLFLDEVKLMKPEEGEKIMEIMTSYERKGREIGREEGRQEGRQEGLQEGRVQVARKMLDKKMSLEVIKDVTGLSIETLERLRDEL
ncbi:Rpn family recombination-promoting nuclease/putative transposase [Evansella sp. AB-rgal1]|uniref:Rpn family recombination-promoting nuclease/putative transposase n=1 Tax=Evansella sp. AB-rgal1 TaxID=3242696 RepID=UPI00359D201B